MKLLGVTALVSLVLSLIAFPFYIRWLKAKQIGQYIREEGPQSHAVKAKTPTMGGLCFIVTSAVCAFLALTLYSARHHFTRDETAPALLVVAVGVACGLVGFADDFGKITSRSNRGLSAKFRLAIEFAFGFVLAAVLYYMHLLPAWLFSFGTPLHLPPAAHLIFMFLVVPFLVAATTNALNLHDGMDGLAGGTSILVFACLGWMLYVSGNVLLAVPCAAITGALSAFMVFNRYPARVFMGDTGSLYLGGLMAAVVAASGLLLWFIPLALIYIAETLSVMAQVVYFKLTKPYTPPAPMSKPALIWLKLSKRLPGEGKRLLRMAPLHHHFEAVGEDRGIPEWQVVAAFWLAQLAICAVTCFGFYRLAVGAAAL